MGAINAPVSLISYTGYMYHITEKVPTEVLGHTLNLPSPAFWVGFVGAAVFAGLGTYMTKKIGSPLIELNKEQRANNGFFRSHLMDIRSNARAIAAYDDQQVELGALRNSYGNVQDTWGKVILRNLKLGSANTVYGGAVQLSSFGVGALAYMLSSHDDDRRNQAVFGHIRSAARQHVVVRASFARVVRSDRPDAARDRPGQADRCRTGAAAVLQRQWQAGRHQGFL